MPDAPRFLDPFGEVRRHGGEGHRLPHWEQDGRTYFLTFRLADALPHHLTAAWREERRIWLDLHPEPWAAAIEQEYHRRFSTRAERWLDEGHGSRALRDATCAAAVESVLTRFDGERFDQHAFVVMPNHVHALVSLRAEESLPDLVGVWKGAAARLINQARGTQGVLWQKDYFDRLIRDPSHFGTVRSISGATRNERGFGKGAFCCVRVR